MPGSFIFVVQGISDDYQVQIYRQIELWPPICTCEDHYWRGSLCKHIMLCLKLMGVDDQDLGDTTWGPEQGELIQYLCNAHECVGNCLQADQRNGFHAESVSGTIHNEKENALL